MAPKSRVQSREWTRTYWLATIKIREIRTVEIREENGNEKRDEEQILVRGRRL